MYTLRGASARRVIHWGRATIIAGALLCADAGPSSAQTGTAPRPAALPATSASPTPSGDRGSVPLSGFDLVAPLRLTLEGSIWPRAREFPQCATLGDDVGNSVGGIPVQHYMEWRLTPRLVLSAFTQLGCPIDAGIGGALTYAVPLRPSMAFVFATGAYLAPAQLPLYGGAPSALSRATQGLQAPAAISARGDLVWKSTSGRPYNVGVQVQGLTKGQITFGAGF
jgi:hypothetical protein